MTTEFCLVCEEPIEGFDLIEAHEVNDGGGTGYICATCWENRPDDLAPDDAGIEIEDEEYYRLEEAVEYWRADHRPYHGPEQS